VRFGLTPAVNALATLMLAATALAVVITALVLRRSRAQVGPGQETVTGLDAALGLR
jgi:ABC-type spermidine/putrescine transport system permease subunit II